MVLLAVTAIPQDCLPSVLTFRLTSATSSTIPTFFYRHKLMGTIKMLPFSSPPNWASPRTIRRPVLTLRRKARNYILHKRQKDYLLHFVLFSLTFKFYISVLVNKSQALLEYPSWCLIPPLPPQMKDRDRHPIALPLSAIG